GADPGPACYGTGGTAPTVTDANLLLGYMDADRLLGGEIQLDTAAARAAISPLAGAMAMSEEEAALGILRVANANMTRALSRITVERGIDGRDCALIAFGGAGPMHAVAVARAFGIAKVVVPARSGVFSALGCVAAEKSYSQQQTLRMESGEWDSGQVAAAREAVRARLAAPLIAAGHGADGLKTETVVGVRYSGQSYAVEIPAPALEDPVALGRAFRDLHERLYGFSTDEPWELVGLRLTVSVPRADRSAFGTDQATGSGPAARTADCVFGPDGPVATPRVGRATLAAAQQVDGPAIFEDEWSTIVLPPGASLRADNRGHLHIDVGSAP
ncbi:MAG: hydantoinase/oxoprolinase family protein, partial [Gammaproteobacteria bacterium]|nr:hydantoinase/oxoprolinase family protein [Gammaproteobacteria bacterium]